MMLFKKSKIKVDFIHKGTVSFESIRSLYEEMKKDKNFKVRHLLNERYIDREKVYFEKKGIQVYSYPTDLDTSDYIIVTSPYYINFEILQKITRKIGYINYGFCPKSPVIFPPIIVQKHFIWKQFVGDKFNRCALELLGPKQKIVELGHPKYDLYFKFRGNREAILNNLGLDPTKKTILYTPTLQSPKSEHLRIYSTFASACESIVKTAIKLNANLIIKAHPYLFGEDEEDRQILLPQKNQLLEAIKKHNNVVLTTDSEYVKYFHASDLCISDVSSMVYEYLVTQKPIITLFSNEVIHRSFFAIPLAYHCYSPANPVELETRITSLLKGEDPEKQQRTQFIKDNFIQPDGKAGYRIKEYIKQDFRRGSK